MTVYKGPRFRILHKPSGARAEVTANTADQACNSMGWKQVDCLIINLGRKIWLNEPKRYITPTRDVYD